jgi:transposase
LLIPNVRKTWAPAGCTPIFYHSYCREKISVIGSLTVSPARKRFGLYIKFHSHNITGTEVIRFLEHLLHHMRGHIVLLWDNGLIHRRKDVNAFLKKVQRLHVFRFPGYAPEINPIEHVWTHGKRDLSNSAHRDKKQMGSHLHYSIGRVRNSQQLLASCIEHSELSWP